MGTEIQPWFTSIISAGRTLTRGLVHLPNAILGDWVVAPAPGRGVIPSPATASLDCSGHDSGRSCSRTDSGFSCSNGQKSVDQQDFQDSGQPPYSRCNVFWEPGALRLAVGCGTYRPNTRRQ